MDLEKKLADIQDRLIKAVQESQTTEIKALKEEIEALKAEARRPKVNTADAPEGLKEVVQKITSPENMKKILGKERLNLELGEDPWVLAQKSVTYNPGNQTVSGDIRNVLAVTNRPGMILLPTRPPSIVDLIPTIPTTSEFIAYVRETASTNNAAYVADAGTKPESAVGAQVERAMIETVAHIIKVPLQLASDVNMFQAFLEMRLVDMLRLAREEAYLYGNGSTPNIRGITNFSGIQTLTQESTWNRIDTIRQALNKLEISYYPWADAIMLHPNDVVKMELLKDGENRYLWPTFGSFASGYNNKSLFGVPIISTTLITEGTFLVGNFSRGVTRYLRQDVTIDIAYENEDDFKKNLMCIRVESRECLVPEDPNCFVLGTFLGAGYD